MNKNIYNKTVIYVSGVVISLSLLMGGGVSYAVSPSAADQTALKNVISKGDQEITRRLDQLNKLDTKISSATKLTASDKSTLIAQVNGEISGLTTLKSKLDNETMLASAHQDAQSIFSEYRVYALITPKVHLIKSADDQQVTEGKLANLAAKFQTRITAIKNAGKDVTALESLLDDLNAKVSASQSISSGIEAKVIGLQPSDYNSDHAVLSDDSTQLQTAHTDNLAAINDAKQIVTQLKSIQ